MPGLRQPSRRMPLYQPAAQPSMSAKLQPSLWLQLAMVMYAQHQPSAIIASAGPVWLTFVPRPVCRLSDLQWQDSQHQAWHKHARCTQMSCITGCLCGLFWSPDLTGPAAAGLQVVPNGLDDAKSSIASSAPSYFAQLKQRLNITTTVGVTVSPPTQSDNSVQFGEMWRNGVLQDRHVSPPFRDNRQL